jgi:DNA repair protein RecN (Recombination protein N)
MLQSLYIKNFALIEEMNLELGENLSALIGESGSGKSLILDALFSLMGGRCSTGNIRQGQERYSLQARFLLSRDDLVKDWLLENGFPLNDNEVNIIRELSKDGKSRVFIQDSLASLSLLKELGGLLCEIHNQNEQLFLLDKNNQLEFIDRFSGTGQLREEMRSNFTLYKTLKKNLEDWELRNQTRQAKKDSLEYQLQEWDRIQPKPGELPELLQEEKILTHGEKLFFNFNTISNCLHEDENSVISNLTTILSSAKKISEIHPDFSSIYLELEAIYDQIRELKHSIREEEEEIFFSPERLDGIQSRIRELNRLEKKYNKPLEELADEYLSWKKQWEELEDSKESIETLKKEFASSLERIKGLALEVSKRRRSGILGFEEEIQKELEALGMKGARIQIVLRWEEDPKGDLNEGEKNYILHSYGLDQAEYYFSANPGEKPRPLRKVASGGEMSRIMLAIRSVLGRSFSNDKLLVFDEIDSGVGGEAAVSMAERLGKLGEHSQILVVTHSQSIAAVASEHWKVEKREKNGRTLTEIRKIENGEKPLELAKMVAGNLVTNSALEHAREMLLKKAG